MILIITFSLFKAARATGGKKRGKYCDAWQAKRHLFLLIKTLTSENSAVVFFFAHSFAVTIRKTYNYSAFVFATALFLCTPHCPRFTFNSPLTSPPPSKARMKEHLYIWVDACLYILLCMCMCEHFCIWCSMVSWWWGVMSGGSWRVLGEVVVGCHCFVGSDHPQCSVVCSDVQGLNAGVIKEQLQGCMDTRQSRPNEVSIGHIGAHAWTKASWHSFRAGPLQGEQTHTDTHTHIQHTSQKQADDNIRDSTALSFNHMGNNEEPRLEPLGLSVCVCGVGRRVCACCVSLHLPITPWTTNRRLKAISH